MAMFGSYSPGTASGYGGGMFEPFDFMTGINDALAQNQAMGAAKPKKGFGNFLQAFAGSLGDSLTGNPVYAQQMQAQAEQERMEQWYERKRQDELADYEAKKGIDAKYAAPEYEGSIDEFQQAKNLGYIPQELGYQDFLKLKNPGTFIPPAPTVIPYGATPISDGGGNSGGGSGLPRVTNQAEYEALPAGSQFIDPGGNVRKKGGQSAAPTGGFL